MVGVTRTLQRRLQSVLNAAAWLVFSARRSEHVATLVPDLHWLKIPERIQFRLCVLAYRCLHGITPPYLAETLHLTWNLLSNHVVASFPDQRRHYSCRPHDDLYTWQSSISSGLECSAGVCQNCWIVPLRSGDRYHSLHGSAELL